MGQYKNRPPGSKGLGRRILLRAWLKVTKGCCVRAAIESRGFNEWLQAASFKLQAFGKLMADSCWLLACVRSAYELRYLS
jgi:hypothetical protein